MGRIDERTHGMLTRRRSLAALAAAGTGGWGVPLAGAQASPVPSPMAAAPHLFGSPVDLRVAPGTPSVAVGPAWIALWQIHRRWNAWKGTELAPLNRAFARGEPARIGADLARVLRAAARLEVQSLGCFNAGIGGLVERWGFHADRLVEGHAPAARELARWRDAQPSLQALEWQGDAVRSANPLLRVDLGAFAKGIAIDDALDRLAAAGVRDALLDLGGNLAVMGGAEGGRRPWLIGIRDPFGPGLAAQLATHGREAVVTSGQYERWRLVDGRREGHVIDPASGRPAAGLASVTVVHRSAALADAASTALLVAGAGRWRDVAARLAVDQVLVIEADGRRVATPALARRLRTEIA